MNHRLKRKEQLEEDLEHQAADHQEDQEPKREQNEELQALLRKVR